MGSNINSMMRYYDEIHDFIDFIPNQQKIFCRNVTSQVGVFLFGLRWFVGLAEKAKGSNPASNACIFHDPFFFDHSTCSYAALLFMVLKSGQLVDNVDG